MPEAGNEQAGECNTAENSLATLVFNVEQRELIVQEMIFEGFALVVRYHNGFEFIEGGFNMLG